MKTNVESPFDSLEKIFHEPNRLAIMSAVCASDGGLSFIELKAQCNLTDGNLNRHLNVLKESGAIRITKEFIDDKPRTTIMMSATGLAQFSQYLSALSDVLKAAKKSLPVEKESRSAIAIGRLVTTT